MPTNPVTDGCRIAGVSRQAGICPSFKTHDLTLAGSHPCGNLLLRELKCSAAGRQGTGQLPTCERIGDPAVDGRIVFGEFVDQFVEVVPLGHGTRITHI